MPTIIDRFVVAFGLDPQEFHKGAESVRGDTKKTREELRSSTNEMERYGRNASGSFAGLKNEVAGLFLTFAGAATVTGFVKGIVSSDAAVGRLAHNLGVATEDLSAWQNAMTDVGGSAEDASAAMQLLAGARDMLNISMRTTGHDWELKRLGVTPEDLNAGPEAVLLKIAERRGAGLEDDNVYAGILRQLGLREAMITVLKRGRQETERLLEAQKRLGVTTEDDARKAAAADKAWNDMTKLLRGAVRPALEDLVDAITRVASDGDTMNNVTYAAIGLLGAAGVAAGIAYGPFLLLAGAIAVLAANFDTSRYAMDRWGRTWEGLKKALFSGSWAETKEGLGILWDEFKIETQDLIDDLNQYNAYEKPEAKKARLARQAARARRNKEPLPPVGTPQGPGMDPYAATGGQTLDAEIVSFFKQRGYSNAAARGIAAGIAAESNNNHRAKNPNSSAYGLAQWMTARQKDFRRVMGKDIRASTKQEQLRFIAWELENTERAAGDKIRAAESDDAALHYTIKDYERPDLPGQTKGYQGDMRRGRAALSAAGSKVKTTPSSPDTVRRWNAALGAAATPPSPVVRQTGRPSQTVTNVNIDRIVVHTAAKDAEGIARELPAAIERRGLTVQANRGLS